MDKSVLGHSGGLCTLPTLKFNTFQFSLRHFLDPKKNFFFPLSKFLNTRTQEFFTFLEISQNFFWNFRLCNSRIWHNEIRHRFVRLVRSARNSKTNWMWTENEAPHMNTRATTQNGGRESGRFARHFVASCCFALEERCLSHSSRFCCLLYS